MTCVRCQTIEAAVASGSEASLIVELYRQLDRLLDLQPLETPGDSEGWVPRDEHERVVAQLNETIAARNAELARVQRKAS